MEFAGFGHITLTVSNYDACLKFYDRLMTHIGMRRYFESPLGVGWFADEYMFVMGHAAPTGLPCHSARAAATKWTHATRCSKKSAQRLFSPPSPVRSGPATIRWFSKIRTARGLR